ncbi:hypothetical protein H633G_03195 [Metarhizium anisopliae BRIP 53284]|nr:hypothetical protein H633G_03195 [Metarhizium anisopliae BRIP 53284]
MESLTVGTMGRAPANQQLGSSPSRLNHRRAQSLDECRSLRMDSKNSSRSLLWLPSVRRQRPISPVFIRSDDNSDRALSPPPSAKLGVSKISPARSVHAYEESKEDAVGKRSADEGSITRTRWSELPKAEQNRGPTRRNSQHIAGQYEQCMDKSRRPSERSFSPFSDSAVTMMQDGCLERLVVTPSLGHHDAWTQSVQLMIKETADAFEAVHENMDDTSLTSWLHDLPETSETTGGPETPADFAAPHTTTQHRQEDKTSNRPTLSKRTKSPIDKPLPLCPETQTMNLLKKESKKVSQPRTSQPTKPARWAVSNGVAQLFSGTRFKRVKADEMLTPEKLEEVRARRTHKDQQPSSFEGRDSSDSSDSAWSRQTTTSSAKSNKNNSNAEKPSVLPLDEAVIHADFSLPSMSMQKSALSRPRSERDTIVVTSNVYPLNPPPKNPQRFVFTNTKAPLPTIPEVESDDELEEPAGRPSVDHSVRSQDSGDLVYLPGTQLSTVNSSFKHGRIACQIADSYVNSDEEMDDSIDSGAYQIAIQGLTSGDSRTATYDDDETDLADDMTAWFSTFGFETHGELIPDGAASPWSLSSHSITSTSPSTVSGDAEAPIPVSSEDGYTFAEPIRFFRSHAPPRKWTPEEDSAKHYTLRYPQGQSFRLKSAPLVVGDGERDCVSEQVAESADLSASMKQDIAALLRWMAAGGDNVKSPSNQTEITQAPTTSRKKSTLAATMLRRPPTTLQITAEDVAAYEDRRANEALAAAQQARAEAQAYTQAQVQAQAQMEGVQESPDAAGRRAREERLGITRRR